MTPNPPTDSRSTTSITRRVFLAATGIASSLTGVTTAQDASADETSDHTDDGADADSGYERADVDAQMVAEPPHGAGGSPSGGGTIDPAPTLDLPRWDGENPPASDRQAGSLWFRLNDQPLADADTILGSGGDA